MTRSQTSAARSPSFLFSSYSFSPSSTIPGVTKTFFPSPISESTSSAALAPTGLELKLSSIIVTPPAPDANCKRCGTGSTFAIAARISSSVIPHAIATAIAARILDTLCLPKSWVRISASVASCVSTSGCTVKASPSLVCRMLAAVNWGRSEASTLADGSVA